MISEQMREARELIKAKRYSEARGILQKIDNPQAKQWLDHLDNIAARDSNEPTYTLQTQDDDWSSETASPTVVPDQQTDVMSYVTGLIGGLVGAFIAGLIWAGIAIVTDLEIGYAAIGVGALAGGGVLLGAGRKRGLNFQLIAVVTSLIGLFLGKYLSAVYFYRAVLIEDFGEAIVNEIGLGPLFTDVIEFFPDYLSASFEAIDILFVVLAIYAAWRIPSLKNAKQANKTTTPGEKVDAPAHNPY